MAHLQQLQCQNLYFLAFQLIGDHLAAVAEEDEAIVTVPVLNDIMPIRNELHEHTPEKSFRTTSLGASCIISLTRCKLKWMHGSNSIMKPRTHSGKYCFGKIPIQIFIG